MLVVWEVQFGQRIPGAQAPGGRDVGYVSGPRLGTHPGSATIPQYRSHNIIIPWYAANIFVSGYAATSVSEYFARGFEEYFIGDRDTLKQLSPVLYRLIDELVNLED